MIKTIEPLRPSKKTRRWALRLSMFFCGYHVAYIIWIGSDSQTHVAALYAMFAYMASIMWMYIKGSSDDISDYNKHVTKRIPGAKQDEGVVGEEL